MEMTAAMLQAILSMLDDEGGTTSIINPLGSGFMGPVSTVVRHGLGFLNTKTGATFMPHGSGSLSSTGRILHSFGSGFLDVQKNNVIRPFGVGWIDSANRTMTPFGSSLITNMGPSLGGGRF